MARNNPTQDCDTEQLESEFVSNVSNFVIQANPNPNQSGMGCFTKYVDVLGCFSIVNSISPVQKKHHNRRNIRRY